MTLNETNCKGYCFFRAGIDQSEQYRDVRYISELLNWFEVYQEYNPTGIIAVAQGSKIATPSAINQQKLVHMAYPEYGVMYSHRADTNLDVTSISYSQLADQFLTELGTYHFLFLTLK
ncbi:MAG: hypothetical protein WCG44_01130 [bacterium]